LAEIQEYIQWHAKAAKLAVEQAGFDGVEVHAANGYLVDQFLQDVSNQRKDQYGGSVEARSRFGLEVIAAIVDAVGPERTAIRLSPWSKFNGKVSLFHINEAILNPKHVQIWVWRTQSLSSVILFLN
jgi:NADPH2 dehydrogenase